MRKKGCVISFLENVCGLNENIKKIYFFFLGNNYFIKTCFFLYMENYIFICSFFYIDP